MSIKKVNQIWPTVLPPSGSSEGTCLCATCANPVQCWQWYWMGRYVYDGKRWGGDHNLAGVVMQLPPLLFCAAGGKEVVWWRVWTERNCEVEKGFDVATSWHQSPVEAKVNAVNAKKELWKGFWGASGAATMWKESSKAFSSIGEQKLQQRLLTAVNFCKCFPFLMNPRTLERNWINCQTSGMIEKELN